MKKILIFVISILIITGGLLTGCGNNVKEDNNNVINNGGNSQVNSGNNSEINNGGNSEINNVENNENNEINEANTGIKKLIECLYLTTEVDSMELNMTTYANGNGQSVVTKTNMKVEDIKSGMKSLLTVEASGQTQEIYLAVSNGITKMYIKDASGKYSVTELSKEQVGNTDVMGAFKVYVELIENNPDLITIIDNDTFELNIPKEKTAEIYSKITGNNIEINFDKLVLDFVVGSDGLLDGVFLNAQAESIDIDITTSYFNYNKKFDIVLPEV